MRTQTQGRQDSRQDDPHNQPLRIDRRGFLKYVGAGAAAVATGALTATARHAHGAAPNGATSPGVTPTGVAQAGGGDAWVLPDGTPNFHAVGYPVPLPGDSDGVDDAARFARYQVADDLTLPAGFRYDVIAQWGDRFGPFDEPERQIHFGYNNDYTGLLPIAGSADEFWLMVNHEYISFRPWSMSYGKVRGQALPAIGMAPGDQPHNQKNGVLILDGHRLDSDLLDLHRPQTWEQLPPDAAEAVRKVCDAAMADLGVSVLRVRRTPGGSFQVVRAARDHRRVFGHGTQNVEPASDGRAVSGTGPAAAFIGKPRGTFGNCSGATTAWGTFITCEENIQFFVEHRVCPDGSEYNVTGRYFGGTDGSGQHPTGTAEKLVGYGHGLRQPLDGRGYGWVCEIDPETGRLTKHTSLGRFRHENIALRAEPGRPLAGYMGDDRRGGHIYKFVSADAVTHPTDRSNSRLLERGTLYVARFNADFTGRWVALTPATPIVRPDPSHTATGHMHLPSRPVGGTVAVGTATSDQRDLDVDQWVWAVEQFASKPLDQMTLGDLVEPRVPGRAPTDDDRLGVILLDAFVMANAAGGTPTSRPEDLEVHPVDKSVYIAFTDNTGDADGSPDTRIFPDSRGKNSRQYGAIYRIVEDGPGQGDPASTTFTWGRFVSSGECADGGGGFACADNLAFDPQANLWVVTDISTEVMNFPVTRQGMATAGSKTFPGVFGNNALFVIPTSGPRAGQPHCFGIGPMDAELTGPTFTADGKALILSVQHPGEVDGVRVNRAAQTREITIATRRGTSIVQERTVPVGSNFPSGQDGQAPRPEVVCIRRST